MITLALLLLVLCGWGLFAWLVHQGGEAIDRAVLALDEEPTSHVLRVEAGPKRTYSLAIVTQRDAL